VNADIVILQEVDSNARRTTRLNIAETIGSQAENELCVRREFQELVQGSKDSRRTTPGYIVEMANFELAPDPLLPTSTFGSLTGFTKDRAFSGETRGEDLTGSGIMLLEIRSYLQPSFGKPWKR